jgi:hypothetical protein
MSLEESPTHPQEDIDLASRRFLWWSPGSVGRMGSNPPFSVVTGLKKPDETVRSPDGG